MGDFILAVFVIVVMGLPVALVLVTQQKKKRGCGRGCASCGNRSLCHPGQYPQPNDPSPAPKPEDHN